MATTRATRSTVIGVFEDRDHATAAIRDLYNAGFPENRIGIAGRGSEGDVSAPSASATAGGEPATTERATASSAGAVAGAVAGASLGGLVGLGIVSGMIPVIGPVIAGGTLAALLANTAGGAAVGGLLGSLTGESYPQDEANYYQAEFEAGRTIVTVDAGERRTDAQSIIALNGGYDLDTQASRPWAMTATGQSKVRAATAAGAAPQAPADPTGPPRHEADLDRP